MDQASTKKMTPGDDMHLTLLMAPHNLNLVTGQDRQHLLAFGRAAFEAGQKCKGCSVPPNGLHQIAEPSHSMSQYASKDDMLKAVLAENEQLRAQLAAAQQGAQDAEPAAWVATFKPEGLLALHSVVGANLEELKQSVPGNSVFRPLYTHPTAQGLDADMFWDADDPEICQTSINNVVVEVDSCRGLKVGDTVTIQRAVKLPDLEVRITMVPDSEGNGDLEWEELAAQAKQGGQ